MKNYWLDALSPLVFRSGKPFGAQSDTQDIVFPLPSAAAGLVRSSVMAQQAYAWQQEQNGRAHLSDGDAEQLKQIVADGLFLGRMGQDGKVTVLVPKPADALYLKAPDGEQTELLRLSPRPMAKNTGCDLPDGLLPVQMPTEKEEIAGKPQSGAQFWAWSDFMRWQRGETLDFASVNKNGASDLPKETRTHTAVDVESGAAKDSQLFQTTAYDFGNKATEHHQGWENWHYGWLIRTEAELQDDLVRFGGEGRLSRLSRLPEDVLAENAGVQSLSAAAAPKGWRMTLLTPAIFAKGWESAWMRGDAPVPHTQNLRVKLRAAALERWQAVSGWDLHQHRPKAMRKAVPAGSVYWLEYVSGDWQALQNLPYQAVSDHEQDRRDGFGTAVFAPWTPPEAQ